MALLRTDLVVLHVDDDPTFVETTKAFLERESDRIAVRTATSPEEGVAILSDYTVDCIVSDYEMPQTNGIEFLRHIRNDYEDLPFILYTGKGSEEVASDAISAGVTDYLQKETGTSQYEVLANRIENTVEQSHTRQELTRNRDLLARTERLAGVGGWEIDVETGDVRWTDGTYAIHELDPHSEFEPTVETALEFYHPDDRAELEGLVERCMNTGENYDAECRLITDDDRVRWVRTTGEGIKTDGEITTVRGAILDITAQKEREQQLTDRTEKLKEATTDLVEQYRYLFEQAPVMGVITRLDDGAPLIDDCNHLFAETLGYKKDELVGEALGTFYTSESRNALLEEGGYERALSGDFVREKRTLVTAEGESIQTLLRSVPRTDGTKETPGTLAFYIDISEQEKLRRKNERLEEFTSIVSHDLRNPLSKARGRAELAQNDCESAHLDAVIAAHDQMETLIEDLLTYARSGESSCDFENIDIAAICNECWQGAVREEATLEIDTDMSVQADRRQLRQLLENLFRNAVEHGGSEVKVTVGRLGQGFYIADDGEGIPPDEREDVLETGYSTDGSGTGFGLSIVRQVADVHGWEMHLTESDAGGTRVEITGVENTAG